MGKNRHEKINKLETVFFCILSWTKIRLSYSDLFYIIHEPFGTNYSLFVMTINSALVDIFSGLICLISSMIARVAYSWYTVYCRLVLDVIAALVKSSKCDDRCQRFYGNLDSDWGRDNKVYDQ